MNTSATRRLPRVIQVMSIGGALLAAGACGSEGTNEGSAGAAGTRAPAGGAASVAGGGAASAGGDIPCTGSNRELSAVGGRSPDASTQSISRECGGSSAGPANGESFRKRVLVEDLESPWEISWGPDEWLWLTERTGKRVVRVRPSDGMRSVAVEIDEVQPKGAQDGLLGMALHPQLLTGKSQDFVYVAYSYEASEGPRYKIRRYSYDPASGSLSAPLDLLSGLPASSDHNAGRLLVGPDQKLYYTIGDQGENQFDRKCNLDRAQDFPTSAQLAAHDYQAYQGKILRLNLDGSIPADNPELNGVRSHIFTFGHRNPQGIAFGPTGVLFSDEQGPKSDDELNRIEAGKNYGWPYVAGYRDDRAYVYGNWSAAPNCDQLPYDDYTIPASVPQQPESAWSDPNFMPPLMTFYTVESNYPFKDSKCGGNAYICWPTIAPSSLEFYSASKQALTGWTDSLLITSLKKGTVYRVALSADGQGVEGEATPLFKTTNRYRDVAVNPNGRTFYVITDTGGSTSRVDGGSTNAIENKGSVLEFDALPIE